MLFALGFVSNFVIGGLSGIYMAVTPVDIFIHDTYFIVAHFHYVVAGIIFGMFAALYYWFPKLFGRMMNEPLGKLHFALTYLFFNGAFFPMHFLGVAGHMRRIYNPLQYEFLVDMQWWNVFITMSAFCLGASQLIFLFNFLWSLFAGKKAERNPWQTNTLEWGVAGHMRRIYNPLQYEFLVDMQWWNVFITMSAFCLGASQLIFLFNFLWSLFAGKKAERNPWQTNTLEWTVPSPPPHGNFETTPTVYRGPYEYSSPLVPEDWLPQDRRLGPEAATATH
jgi:heme/copper-type cytochrome/quinol oxidase subunit 1